MKKMKKLAAILLSLAMAAMLSIPALAAGEYSITINNEKSGHTYEAYQIFAGDVAGDGVTDGETAGPILSNVTWGNGVDADRLNALLAALKADETIGAKFVDINDADDAAAIADALDGADAADAAAFADVVVGFLDATPTGQTNTHVNNTHYIIDGLPAGYYLVKEANVPDNDSATDYIVQVLGNVTMNPKDTDIPTVEKKVAEEDYHQDDGYGTTYNDVADWDIGDSVPFKLIGAIPDMSAYDAYEYIFTDTLSDGLTLQAGTIKVYIAREKDDEVRDYTPLTAGEDYTLDIQNVGENGGGTFSIAFDDLKTAPYIDEGNRNYVIVTYDATLNANAEIGLDGNPNSVYLEFSNDPNGDGMGRTTEDTVIVFTYELDGTKVDGEDMNTKLQGAEFVLFNGGHTKVAHVENGKLVGWVNLPDGYTYENYTEIPYETWEEMNVTTSVIMTSTPEGVFGVSGLDDSTLYLREIKAPTGYNLLDAEVKVVVSATTANGQTWTGNAADALTALKISVNDAEAVDGDLDTGIVNVTVANNQGSTLPETGGIGTTIFFVLGGVLVIGAGILLIVRLRMKAVKKD